MSQQYFDQLLKKYLLGECSKEEEVLVLTWYQQLIDESKLDISDQEKERIRAKIWSAMDIEEDINEVAPVKPLHRTRSRSFIYRAAIAASIILGALGWLWYSRPTVSNSMVSRDHNIPSNQASLTNKSESEQEIRLTDGSIVLLQPNGTIYYPKIFNGESREVYLTGNAFFKVSHDTSRHFIVHTAGLVTEVLGTSFSISQSESAGKLEIAVVTGKVSVYQKDKRVKNVGQELQAGSVILTPNQKVTYNSTNSQFITSLVEEPKPLDQFEAHVENFVFEDVPISEVLEELRLAYGIEIFTDNKAIETCHFTGDITKQDLYKKLEIICQSLPSSSYEVRGVNIIIKGKGCDESKE